MKTLRDFVCEKCGTIQERFLDGEVICVDCACGAVAKRMIGMPMVQLEGITGAFPGAHDRWARIREEKFRGNIKRNYENGE